MKKKGIIIICAIVLCAAVIAVGMLVRGQQMKKETAGALRLICGEKEVTVSIKDMDKAAFSGETVNGKGDVFRHDYRGIELQELLSANKMDPAGVDSVTAVAADQFSAELTGDEVREDGRIYLAVSIDGTPVEGIDAGTPGVQLVVFRDSDSRRNVRNLNSITVKTKQQ
ncbi:MAG: hypothetical protein IJ242_05085 [Clostridia bacterium]|nr:hypothetical protein [Clostridia bacterium]